MPPDTPTGLPERLRLGTRELHLRAERSGVMAALIAGRIERPAYTALLRNLHAIYAALEAALDGARAGAALPWLDLPALRREGALAADLDELHGPRWRVEIALAEAAVGYVQRLQCLAAQGSPMLVAHAYVRYLGDLHGGQVLRRQLARSLGLADAAGTRFYDFGSEAQVLALRLAFRSGLAAHPATQEQVDQLVAEARWAFEQHQRLFEQLPGGERLV